MISEYFLLIQVTSMWVGFNTNKSIILQCNIFQNIIYKVNVNFFVLTACQHPLGASASLVTAVPIIGIFALASSFVSAGILEVVCYSSQPKKKKNILKIEHFQYITNNMLNLLNRNKIHTKKVQ